MFVYNENKKRTRIFELTGKSNFRWKSDLRGPIGFGTAEEAQAAVDPGHARIYAMHNGIYVFLDPYRLTEQRLPSIDAADEFIGWIGIE